MLQLAHTRANERFFAVEIVKRKLSSGSEEPLHLSDLLSEVLGQASLLAGGALAFGSDDARADAIADKAS